MHDPTDFDQEFEQLTAGLSDLQRPNQVRRALVRLYVWPALLGIVGIIGVGALVVNVLLGVAGWCALLGSVVWAAKIYQRRNVTKRPSQPDTLDGS